MSSGRAWERLLEAQHDKYRRKRLAVVFKTEPRRDRTGKYIEKAPPDYCGAIWPRGRAVCFDAKDCKIDRFDLRRIKPHQAQDLEAIHQAGGLAFLAIRMPAGQWVAGWAHLREHYQAWRKGEGKASINAADLDWFAFPMTGGDWWEALDL